MPTKKVIKKLKKFDTINIQELIQSSNSYKSLVYGVLTVVVVFIIIMLGINTLSPHKRGIVSENAAITEKSFENQKQVNYTVSQGETLWSISEKFYGTGFKWIEIAKSNNIVDATKLEQGAKLSISETAITPEPTKILAPTGLQESQNGSIVLNQKISDSTYTIQRGDNLWVIAVKAYGDGYKWVDIAKVNKLTHPNLIFAGNVLQMPR